MFESLFDFFRLDSTLINGQKRQNNRETAENWNIFGVPTVVWNIAMPRPALWDTEY